MPTSPEPASSVRLPPSNLDFNVFPATVSDEETGLAATTKFLTALFILQPTGFSYVCQKHFLEQREVHNRQHRRFARSSKAVKRLLPDAEREAEGIGNRYVR